jgi:hypothetical protein
VLTGSPIEVLALLLAPPIGLLGMALSAALRESVVARRVLGIIALLSLVEIALLWMVFSTMGAP